MGGRGPTPAPLQEQVDSRAYDETQVDIEFNPQLKAEDNKCLSHPSAFFRLKTTLGSFLANSISIS